MEIIVAKNSGFCMGVKRAIDTVLSLKQKPVYVYGEIIHNEGVLKQLEESGVVTIDDYCSLTSNDTLVIRSHGVGKKVLQDLAERNINVVNLTCPFVMKTQKIVEDYYGKGYQIIIFGKKDHPEVVGLNGWCEDSAIIFDNESCDIMAIDAEKICIVAQTTASREKFDEFLKNFDNSYSKTVEIFKTICYTTLERQKEADSISKKCEAMVVIGGTNSSNTKKLYDVCKSNCKNTYLVSSPKGLDYKTLNRYESVGIVSGASTPISESMEVYLTMSEKIIDSMEQAVALLDEKKPYKRGQKITVFISQVDNDGLKVHLDGKTEIEIPKAQLINEDMAHYESLSELEVVVLGTKPRLELSERQILVIKQEEELVKELNEGKIINVKIDKFNKGGLTGKYEAFDVFVPASEIRIGFVNDFEKYVGKSLKVKALKVEYNNRKKEIVASQKVILVAEKAERDAERQAKEDAFFASISENDVVTGTVARFAQFGAFVVVNGFDCLAHVSDLSWTGVNTPADVLEVGKEYDFGVLKVDKENKKVSIGYKQLQPKPWDCVADKYQVGDVVTGKIVRIVSFGAFVEVEKGVDGLVHVSQICHEFLENPASKLKVGDEVNAKILAIDVEKEKLTLSIKATLEAPVKEEKVEEDKPKKEKKAKKEDDEDMRGWTESSDGGISIAELLSK